MSSLYALVTRTLCLLLYFANISIAFLLRWNGRGSSEDLTEVKNILIQDNTYCNLVLVSLTVCLQPINNAVTFLIGRSLLQIAFSNVLLYQLVRDLVYLL